MAAQRRPKVVHAGQGIQLDVQGIRFSYKATAEDTGGRYAFTEGVIPPHHGAPLHIHHREDEAFYILEGEFEIECDDEVFRVGPGTFALLPKDSPTDFKTCRRERAEFFAFSRRAASKNSLRT
jgi:mannose-6-phosphate isomerase-like protein (cupin superfamily)